LNAVVSHIVSAPNGVEEFTTGGYYSSLSNINRAQKSN
jgi:hypothetical protein